MTALRVDVLGIGAWAAGFEGWPAMRAALRGDASSSAASSPPSSPPSSTSCSASIDTRRPSHPSPALLPATERRRAPESVAVALEVAREAVGMASATHAIEASSLASVFASAYGDLAIVDYLCATLATDPMLLSPTRFHHSVHNAAAAYWSIATHDTGPASAIAAGDATFAAGLLEAATQACAENRAVLLVAFDTPAVGSLPMDEPNTALFGMAMVLAPTKHPVKSALAAPTIALTIEIRDGATSLPFPKIASLHALSASSPSARALALIEALASERDARIEYPLSAASTLAIDARRAG